MAERIAHHLDESHATLPDIPPAHLFSASIPYSWETAGNITTRITARCGFRNYDDLLLTVLNLMYTGYRTNDGTMGRYDITELASLTSQNKQLIQHRAFPAVLSLIANTERGANDASWMVLRSGLGERLHNAAWADTVTNGFFRGFTDLARYIVTLARSGELPFDTNRPINGKSRLIGYGMILSHMVAILSIPDPVAHPSFALPRLIGTAVLGQAVGNIGVRKLLESDNLRPTVSAGEHLHLYTWR